ncbi:hypothetical protein A1F99_116810 [Pyrenophora tritici-repentis]|nr:hypothetical protein A1F99_116810 [Pyrenophora tritici-repentis]
MLGSDEGFITKLASYLTADRHPVPDETPSTEDETSPTTPLTSNATREDNISTGNNESAKSISTTGPRRSIARSASETVVPSQTHSERLTAITVLNTVHFKEGERRVTNVPQHLPRAALQPPRRATQRSISNSRLELSSPNPDAATPFTALQKQHKEQAKFATSRLPRPARARLESSLSGPATRSRPSPTRSTALRSSSDPDLTKAFANPRTRDRNVPLKPCIKKKAGSVIAPPPEEFQHGKVTAGSRTLRRVKTVDFEGNGSSSSFSLSPGHFTQDRPNPLSRNNSEKTTRRASVTKKIAKTSPSCPNTIGTTKSSVADTAVTRTDVHVIAIAPQWDAQDVTNDEDIDPATPTMQIIETKSASYEIVWDDVPPEHSARIIGRRSSSASHALEAAAPGAPRGLERVNSKLACWSGTWNTPSEKFKPTIVVFPDDDGRSAYHDCAIEVDDELLVSAPPNSQMTSCTSSRFPSCPPSRTASAPMTRTASKEEMTFSDALRDTLPQLPEHLPPVLEQALPTPDGEVRIGGGRDMKPAIGFRKLSNVDEADTRFRGHRDSVTMAHSRLVRSGGVSAELFAHRDSISIGKKRIHARNHATSAVRAIPRRRETICEMRNFLDDDDMSGVSMPAADLVKERAAQALRNSSSPSMLRPPQQTPNQRHIRIVE